MNAEDKKKTRLTMRLSIVISLCSGMLTGLFSTALNRTLQSDWTWGLALVIVVGAIGYFVLTSYKDIEEILKEE